MFSTLIDFVCVICFIWLMIEDIILVHLYDQAIGEIPAITVLDILARICILYMAIRGVLH